MRIVLVYDVTHGHTAIKNACSKHGFFTSLNVAGTLRKLPNTTLVGDFPDAEAAIAQFSRLVAQAAPLAVIEKVLAAACDLPTLYSDEVA